MQFPRADIPLAFPQKRASETGGILFNRKDPTDPNGETVPILDRDGNEKKDSHNYVVNEGKDFTGLKNRSSLKYRIPSTSVVNRVGDCSICGLRLTAAQWIWVLNLVCFCAHTTMAVLTMYFAYWSKDLSHLEYDPYNQHIYRIKSKWTNNTAQIYELSLVDTGYNLNIAVLVTTFFVISAVAHLFALVFGSFETFWFFYWRQIDDAFVWWR